MIIAGGDSFVYGSELDDSRMSKTGATQPSKSTFTALLAREDYTCAAWPGYGNDSIARTVINACEQHTNIGVIVSWTFPGRYEFRFSYDTQQRTGPWYTITPWTIVDDHTIIKQEFVDDHDTRVLEDHVETIRRARATGVADFAQTYYKHVGSSEYWEVYSTLKEIVYLQNYLTVKQIPFMFTCADNSILYNHTVNTADATISAVYNQIDMTKWFWFPAGTQTNETCEPRGFYQWALENKYPVGTTHPLEPAHVDAAELMKDKFNELVKKHLQ